METAAGCASSSAPLASAPPNPHQCLPEDRSFPMPSTPRDTPRRESPRRPAVKPDDFRFAFEAGEYRYEVTDPLVIHPDYDTLFLAWRRPLSGGPRLLVELKKIGAVAGRDARASAR